MTVMVQRWLKEVARKAGGIVISLVQFDLITFYLDSIIYNKNVFRCFAEAKRLTESV